MPSPVVHIGVALVALQLYFDDRHRIYALLLVPFAVLPDLDYLIPSAHRVVFHNVFMLVPLFAIALYGLATRRKVLFDLGLLASFCAFSHLMIDLSDSWEVLFYPLSAMKYDFAISPALLRPIGFFSEAWWSGFVSVMLCFSVLAGILAVKRLLSREHFWIRT